jgi:hypothetical protein
VGVCPGGNPVTRTERKKWYTTPVAANAPSAAGSTTASGGMRRPPRNGIQRGTASPHGRTSPRLPSPEGRIAKGTACAATRAQRGTAETDITAPSNRQASFA